jgi:hypothetical protein
MGIGERGSRRSSAKSNSIVCCAAGQLGVERQKLPPDWTMVGVNTDQINLI